MIPVEPSPLRAWRGPRLLAVALAIFPCALVQAAPPYLPPGAVLVPPPGAVVVPAPVGTRAMRQNGERGPPASTPTVSIQVVAPATAAPGKEMTYRIVAENTSDAAAHHVLVKATLSRSGKVVRPTPAAEVTSPEGAPPEKATVVTWKLETLAAGGKRDLTLVVMPAGDDEITCCARVQFEHGLCVRTRIGKPAVAPAVPPDKGELAPVAPLPPPPPVSPTTPAPPATVARPREKEPEKERQPPALAALRLRQTPSVSSVTPGEAITYVYEVTNVGNAPAKDVVLEATPAESITFLSSKPSTPGTTPVTWKLGEIAPGASKSVEYSVAGEKLGRHVNKAVVKAEGGLRREDEHSVLIGQSTLDVVVVGPSQRAVLRDATYLITVKNVGDVPALDVELSDEPIKDEKVGDAVKPASASNGGSIAGNVARWSLGKIAPGAERTVSVVLRAKGPGDFTYLCTARSKTLVVQGRTRTKFVEPAPLEIELDRLTNATKVKVGAEVDYALRLRNGGAKENTNVEVILDIGDGLELVEVITPPDRSRPKGQQVRLPPVPRLTAAHGGATLRFRATKPGEAKFSVKAISTETGPDKAARLEEVVVVGE